MPTQAADAISRVADSVERLATASHQLHTDVDVMNSRQQRQIRQQRLQTFLLALVIVAVILLAFSAVVDYKERQEAKEARVRIEETQEEIRDATSPQAREEGEARVAQAVAKINATNIAIAQCEREQAPSLEQCVAARVTQP